MSQDKTAHKEIWAEVDQHTDNQLRLNLPSRLIAKTFVFRLIYGGSAYSYANDPDFASVSKSEKYWQDTIVVEDTVEVKHPNPIIQMAIDQAKERLLRETAE